jgi:hypothetical protein
MLSKNVIVTPAQLPLMKTKKLLAAQGIASAPWRSR